MKKKERDTDIDETEKTHRPQSAVDWRTRGLWIGTLVLLAMGLALSGELVRLHIKAAADAAYHSYCSVNATVSCDTVARSEYAILFGVPLAVWGVFGYGLMTLIAAFGLRGRSRVPAVLFTSLAVFSLAGSVVLAAISHYVIHAWCLVCIGTYAVNLGAVILSIFLMRKIGVRAGVQALVKTVAQHPSRAMFIASGVGVVVLGLIAGYPPPPAEPPLLPAPPEKSDAGSDTTTTATEDTGIPPMKPGAKIETGVTEDGLPWIGAADPVVTITEFFDYECSHCRKTFHVMHRLLESNADRLRLVVRHFPLNSDCNRFVSRPIYRYSCINAKLANCAGEQGQFWKGHEYLFNNSYREIETDVFVETLSLDRKKFDVCIKKDNEALNSDIEAGIELDIHGTPVFVIDGKTYLQYLPRFLATKLRPPAPPQSKMAP